jgi:Xaa-Pro aminopeptidase
MLAAEIKPGVTTLELDKKAETFIRDHNAIPGFLGLYDFPNTLCMSPNAQVVHGIPNKTPLQEGDIISIDCGVLQNGYYGDHAYTFAVGEIDPETEKLLERTKAIGLVMWAMPFSSTLSSLDMASYGNWSDMDWEPPCTKNPKCPITENAAREKVF